MKPPVPTVAAIGLCLAGAAGLAACSSSAPRAVSAPVTSTPTSAAAPAVVPTVAPVSSCSRVDPQPLDTAFLSSSWTAGAPKLTGGTCVTTVTAAGGGSITLTLAPTAAAAAVVDSFRSAPPPLPGRVVLDDLQVSVPSTGIYASGKGGAVSYLLVAAEPAYSVSVQASLGASIQGSTAPVSAATAMAKWAVAQKI